MRENCTRWFGHAQHRPIDVRRIDRILVKWPLELGADINELKLRL